MSLTGLGWLSGLVGMGRHSGPAGDHRVPFHTSYGAVNYQRHSLRKPFVDLWTLEVQQLEEILRVLVVRRTVIATGRDITLFIDCTCTNKVVHGDARCLPNGVT